MGMTVKAVKHVKRGTFDLRIGQVYELDDHEAKTLIQSGDVEPVIVRRTQIHETADNPPMAERAVSKPVRQPRGKRRSSGPASS